MRVAQAMRKAPPSYEWLRMQPVGWVREVLACWHADVGREASAISRS